MVKSENEQFGSVNRLDSLRQELDGKIDKKVSNQAFYWILGAVLGATAIVFTYACKVNDRVDDVSKRMTVIETKIEDMHAKP